MIEDLVFYIMQAADVVARLFHLHHVDRVDNLLRFFLLRVELDVPARLGEIIKVHCELWPPRSGGSCRGDAAIPKFLAQMSLLCPPNLSKHFLNIAWCEGALPSTSDLFLHHVQQVLRFQVRPAIPFQ